ncbi:PAS domain S-box-containing protein [Desulfatibacillum alkenivorans DSM 16219]|uniref:histidine kinase n=1 Tax=Desulfatibacillum alkenivorans DSM 16219 TaxID=1121393 RepID=A0A1M6DRH6_9BACT|nr:response regulator [Desulfatibacillum alkenivorans]SHI75795.1 PAS domain S-box-containing protein [Desulfatibacillum alkenivorans DSM 16219]
MPDQDKSSPPPVKSSMDSFLARLRKAPDGWTMEKDRVLQALFFGVIALGGVSLIISNIFMMQENKWGLVFMDVLFFLWLSLVYLQRKSVSREMVILHFMVLTYLVGGAVLFFAGPLRAGILYLFTFQIMTAGFFGARAAKASVALNFILLAAVGIAAGQGYLTWDVAPEKRLFLWISISTNFLFLTVVASIVIVSRNREFQEALDGERAAAAELRLETREKEAAVQALRQSESKYRQLVENITEVVFSVNAEGRFTYISPRVREMLGWAPEDLLEKSFFDLMDKDQRTSIPDWLSKARSGRKSSLAFKTRTKDQEERWVSAALAPSAGDQDYLEMFGLLRDITQHKKDREERELLESRLAQAQKMEAIGRLAGGIAHDFNNMLSPVLGYAEMLSEDFAHDPQARENLSEIVAAANRAKDLVRQILIFGSKAEDHPRPLDLGVQVSDALRLVKASLPPNITLVSKIEPLHFVVNADPTQIQRVLMNICANASHAMGSREGLLEVLLEQDHVSPDKNSPGKNPKPGPCARLTIKDNGHGIAPENLDKIFEPYFTTKGVGEGAGIGLAVAHSIVSKLGGAIQVSSKLGEWTCFCILLPLAKGAPKAQKKPPQTPLPNGSGRILLVDDEPSLVQMTKQMLNRLGYETVTASDGKEAIKTLESAERRFDLLITDYSMPGFTGDQLALYVQEKFPGLPVVLCTGYSDKVSRENAAKMGISAMLSKPVNLRQLALTAYRLTNPK